MKLAKTSVTLLPGMLVVLDVMAAKVGCTRSELMRRLIVFASVKGIECGVTDRFFQLDDRNQSLILDEIRGKLAALPGPSSLPTSPATKP